MSAIAINNHINWMTSLMWRYIALSVEDNHKKHTVLCVDDELAILSSLKRLLRNEPYNLLTTTDPSQALNYVEKGDVSLAIIDQRMPIMTGLELAKAIRERSKKTSIIVLTGYPDDVPIVKNIIADKIDRLLFKPWNDKELKEIILGFLRQS